MRRFILCAAATLAVAFSIAATPAAADDRDTCKNGAGKDAIDACTRLIMTFNKSGVKNPRDVIEELSRRGFAYDNYGDYENAIADYDSILRVFPDLNFVYGLRGLSYKHKRDHDHAIADFDQAIRLGTKDAFIYHNRGETYYQKGDYVRAIADFDQAIKLNPKYVRVFILRGATYLDKGDSDQAIADFGQAIRLDPKQPEAFAGRGDAYQRKDDYDRAIADYDEAIRLDPKYVHAYIGRGSIYEDKGDHDRAIADFDQAITINPDDHAGYAGRSIVYLHKGDYDGAIAALDQAIKLKPKSALYYSNRAMINTKKGDLDRAIADYDQAVKLDPKNDGYYINRGVAYFGKRDYEHAAADFDDAIRLDPRNAQALANRAETFARKGVYDRAIADAEAATRLEPKLSGPHAYLAYVFAKMNDFGRAQREIDDAFRLNGKSSDAFLYSGEIHLLKKEPQAALRDFESALALSPSLLAREGRDAARSAMAVPGAQPSPAVSTSAPPVAPTAQASERRVALVIGNSDYRSAPFLPNPRGDALAVADALRQAGFQTVQLAVDLDRDAMAKALRSFRSQADKADWALIYFAGHGIEINGVNYLIPVDAKLVDDRDVGDETVSYQSFLSAIGGAKAFRLLVLDACRANPFKEHMQRTVASRNPGDRGLAPPPEVPGTLVVYSAKVGEVAADDGAFARAFVGQLKVPGREVRRLFDYVRDDVLRATGKRQQPFTYGSLPGDKDFFFIAAK